MHYSPNRHLCSVTHISALPRGQNTRVTLLFTRAKHHSSACTNATATQQQSLIPIAITINNGLPLFVTPFLHTEPPATFQCVNALGTPRVGMVHWTKVKSITQGGYVHRFAAAKKIRTPLSSTDFAERIQVGTHTKAGSRK